MIETAMIRGLCRILRATTGLAVARVSLSRQSLVKARNFYVATVYFCVVIDFGLGWGFYVSTEFGLDRGF